MVGHSRDENTDHTESSQSRQRAAPPNRNTASAQRRQHTHPHLQPKQLEVALDYARVGDVRVGVAIRADAHSDGAHSASNAVNDGHLQRVVNVKPALQRVGAVVRHNAEDEAQQDGALQDDEHARKQRGM